MEDFNIDELLNDINIDTVSEPEPEPETELEPVTETKLEPVSKSEPAPVNQENIPVTFDNTGVEFAEETKSYARAFLDIELRKKELQQEAKDLKDEYKEQGVDCTAVNKAMRALAKEIKETAEEAQVLERVKEMFRKDDSIYTTIVGLSD